MAKLDKTKFDDRQLIELIYDRVDELEKEIRSNYVKKQELVAVKDKMEAEYALLKQSFQPVQKVVYGIVSLILTAVVGGLLALVITQ